MREATARRRASAWLVAAVFAICAVAFALARVGFAHVNRSATGVAVGRLPAWVRMADLNLLVITLDTTRADRLGAYGWPDSVTPAIDSLARQGILFERAVSAAPLTLPSHSSMFTGKYPPRH